MLAKKSQVFFVVLITMLGSQLLFGASSTIEGKVTDAFTHEPLFGANIYLVGTSIGAATDIKGRYIITNVPAGTYTLKASYLGYENDTININLREDVHLEVNIELQVVTVSTSEVVITGQASGQNSAINQQLTSDNISNVVSSSRIQQLPDFNAAESIGRLPGISLVRSGGEATKVVIRGLQPQYNTITVDGVAIPSNDPNNRSTDLRMISSYTLEGIEVYKTVTPDMDASVLGGTVNFNLREAKDTPSGTPLIFLLAQGAYNDIMSSYKDYKFVASIEKRFVDNKLGVFLQGIVQRQNLTSNQLGVSYYQPNKQDKPDSIVLGSINLSFSPNIEKRYNATLTLDYKLSNGKISLVNLFSHGKTNIESHSETYNLANYGNDILFGTQLSSNELNVISNILNYEQNINALKLNVKLSNSYSDNRTPFGWSLYFDQINAGTNNIRNFLAPVEIAKQAELLIDINKMFWQNNYTWNIFNKQNDVQGSIDLERNFNFSEMLSVSVKAGGSYKYTTRYYDYNYGSGSLYSGAANGFRLSLVQALPWLTQSPYNFDPTGARDFPMLGFYDPEMDFGKFLKGEYTMYSSLNADILNTVMNTVKALGEGATYHQTVISYFPDQYQSIANDYSGNESRSAVYIMAKINIGSQITIIPGVRYQGLKTTYTAAHFLGTADLPNPYPDPIPHIMETKEVYHGYWLPDISLKYDLFTWLSLRGSYTSTLAYPDFNSIVPRLDVSSNSGHFVVWNNYALKPAYSHNYDVQVAVYNNDIGLFAVTPFLKRIDDLIFSQSTYITDPSKYDGVPSYTKTFALTTFINNPYTVDLWGIETEWQTHFWYLPGLLSGLVLNFNYTHIFSEAKYPYTVTVHSPVYPFPTTYIDSTYTDRLIQQPDDIVNLSLGFDYDDFSILTSLIYQAEIYNGTNFYNSLRSDKAKYLRWDLSVKQGLPWFNLEVFLDLNDLNSEEDTYLVRGSGFPNSISHYGLTVNLGIRWKSE